jgi:hypothetical protein
MTTALTILALAVLAALILLPEPKPEEPDDWPEPEKGFGEAE